MATQNPTRARFIEDYLLYLLARASHLVSAEFHAQLRQHGVTVPVWRVLASLSGSNGETVTGLADACLLQQPTMTKLLDRMERDSLVRRVQEQQDRRVVRVVLTAKGESKVNDLLQAAKQHETQVMALHPQADAATIKDLLRDMIARHGKTRRTPKR